MRTERDVQGTATGHGWGQGGQQPEPALGQEQAIQEKPN